MEENSLISEKQSIRGSVKSLKKYGSTCNHVRNNEILIPHMIGKNETLQGIALKYGCTTEQIRRSNRLFATDSLFLRELLMIPVDKNSPFYPKNGLCNIEKKVNNNNSNDNFNNSSTKESLNQEDNNKKDIDDFLGKIDSTIAESKNFVRKSQKSKSFSDEECLRNQQYPSSSYQLSRQNTYNNPDITSHVVVMTQGRRIQSSLQKLEKQQDEFFQL